MKYTYKTVTDSRGNVERYRCWKEEFKDAQGCITINRNQLIKLNGKKVTWCALHQFNQLSPSQLKSIQLKYK